jgi:hypothetical protein
MNRWVRLAGRGLLYMGCCSLTVLVLANSYVSAFGKPLPFINAVRKVDLSFIQPQISTNLNLAMQADARFEGNYGAPSQIKVGENKVRIPVAQPLRNGDDWLARASTAHYIIRDKAKNGDIGDTIVYVTAGKTTIPKGYITKPGDNISLDTKRDWRYFYKVDEVLAIQKDQKYVLPSSQANHLYVVILEVDGSTTVIAASLTNVQNADQ